MRICILLLTAIGSCNAFYGEYKPTIIGRPILTETAHFAQGTIAEPVSQGPIKQEQTEPLVTTEPTIVTQPNTPLVEKEYFVEDVSQKVEPEQPVMRSEDMPEQPMQEERRIGTPLELSHIRPLTLY